MSKGTYERYEGRYNRGTAPVAVNNSKRWTVAEEAYLLKMWCRVALSAEARIHVARVLGRTYVACLRRHVHCHRRGDDWSACKADLRRRVS